MLGGFSKTERFNKTGFYLPVQHLPLYVDVNPILDKLI